MTSQAVYNVDSYHINVEMGDGAIHLLVQRAAASGALLALPRILGAVLIDGGHNRHQGFLNVDATLAHIQAAGYADSQGVAITNTSANFQFDSIVVTHWDQDHWNGIVRLFNVNMAAQINAGTVTVDDVQCSYLKYNSRTGAPETTLYAPYWYGKSGTRMTEQKGFAKAFVQLDTTGPSLTCSFRVVDMAAGVILGIRENFIQVSTQRNASFLGANFFSGDRLPTTTSPTTITSVEKLLSQDVHKKRINKEMRPGMYCVAADRNTIGPLRLGVVNALPTLTNQHSIACMIIWPDGRLSHYFAGDLSYDIEQAIVKWSRVLNPSRNLMSMKSSHHGAATSTPVEILENWDPQTIIISAGNDYGHPRWELMFYIEAQWLKVPRRRPVRRVWPCRYPYYLYVAMPVTIPPTWLASNPRKISPGAFFNDGIGQAKYRNDLTNLYNSITPATGVASPLVEFNDPVTGASGLNRTAQLAWLNQAVADRWDNLSLIRVGAAGAAGAAPGAAAVGAANSVASDQSTIEFLLLQCRSTDLTDGQVSFKTVNDPVFAGHLHTFGSVAPKAQMTTRRTMALRQTLTGPRTTMRLAQPSAKQNLGTVRIMPELYSAGEDVDPDEGSDTDDDAEDTVIGRKVNSRPHTTASKATSIGIETGLGGLPTTGYTFFCSALQEQTSSTTFSLGQGDLNDFITALHWGMLTLSSTPPSETKATTVQILAQDEWSAWFTEALPATNFSVSTTTTSVASFQVTISIPSVKTGVPSLDFDTAAVNNAFDLSTAQALQPNGLLSGYDTLIFGLSPEAKDVDFTLNDLFHFAGQPLPGADLVGALSDVTLTLRPGKDRGDRNAIWFVPSYYYRTVVRLEPHLDTAALTTFNRFLEAHLSGLQVLCATVVAKKTMNYVAHVSGAEVETQPQIFVSADAQLSINKSTLLFTMTMTFSPQTLDFTLEFKSGGVLQDCVDWLVQLLGVDLPCMQWIDKAAAFLDKNLQLRRVYVQIAVTNKGPKVVTCKFDAQVTLSIGGEKTDTDQTKVAIRLTYCYPSGKVGKLTGCIWPAPLPPALPPRLDPLFEPFDQFDPLPDQEGAYTFARTFNLENLYPNGDKLLSIPDQIPHNVCQALLQIDSDGIYFSGLITTPPQTPVDVPTISLNQLGLIASYKFGSTAEPTVQLTFTVQLTPPAKTYWPVALLDGRVMYSKTAAGANWTLAADLQDLNVAALYSFFDSDTQDTAMQMMAKIFISRLDLEYQYSSGKPSSFLFTGILLFGDLELDLTYTYNPPEKRFSAVLGADSKQASTATLGSVIASISDDVTGLPSFVADIAIPSAAGKGGLVSIDYFKSSTAPLGDYVIFIANIDLDVLSFTYVQFFHASWPKGTSPKRLLRVAVQALGHDISMPILGTLPQPFDEMDFIWVQDSSGQAAPGVFPGFTVQEIGAINDELGTLHISDTFRYKNINSQPKPTDVVLKEGKHFIEDPAPSKHALVLRGRETTIRSRSMDIVVREDPPADVPSAPPAMAAATRSFGPLTMSNIGLQYKDSALFVIMDAKMVLGPIEFELLGFGLGIDLSNGMSLTKFPKPEATISGLAIGFNAPPVLISGLFSHISKPGEDMYVGGVAVDFDPYTFLAAGGYGTITPASGTSYHTVFLFADLQGPLIDLEFIELSDVCGGFGYNSAVTLPTASQVFQFPFIGDNMTSKVGGDPLATITNLTDGVWITPRPSSLWLAFGAKVEAFSVLSIDAVVVVEFNPYVTLGIFADAIATVPPSETDGASSQGKLAYVELGITGVVDFQAGSLIVTAQLAPSSFILDPDCHLTGGFALATWFGSEHSGDWVFSLGGYHAAYQKPAHYPDVPRLAINWSLDDCLSITGNAYFAITPKVCMAGGLLQAQLSCGPLGAHYDCWADFLINYKPFNFVGDVGVSVGVSFSLDLLFVTIYIDVEIGASVHLTGLPIQGYVHVDFWVFGFDIHFGPDPGPTLACTLPAFWDLLLQQSKTQQQVMLPGDSQQEQVKPTKLLITPAVDPGHKLTVDSGMATGNGSQTSTDADTWNVRAGTFAFRVVSIFALQTLQVNAQPVVGSTDTKLQSRPMHITKDQTMTSTMTIQIASEQAGEQVKIWGLERVDKSCPVALWGAYDPNQDPLSPNTNTSDLLNGSTQPSIPLLMGTTCIAPPPTLSSDIIPAFSAIDLMSKIVSDVEFPNTTDTASSSWNAAPRKAGAQQWTAVEQAWNVGNGPPARQEAADFVNAWIDLFGWDDVRTSEQGKSGTWRWQDLDPAPPGITLRNLSEVYMAAPCISV
ncbi:uncharacterized protein AB675_11081 [Cyphellophora attinorum]|uniref:DUF6603 domain-containing protein n=1 Tax=Cyphellophora attinorum TaxID=1664694 RepID=A0A0N0NIG6_9EURO|nr:uncharacterized protein AB675_11081 [Phialophora attinorum]KPI35811.1 hypothetical protein AB675_11081 [Phialophora attinorum]